MNSHDVWSQWRWNDSILREQQYLKRPTVEGRRHPCRTLAMWSVGEHHGKMVVEERDRCGEVTRLTIPQNDTWSKLGHALPWRLQ